MSIVKNLLPSIQSHLEISSIIPFHTKSPMTHFEAKYLKVNHPIYEMTIKMPERTPQERQFLIEEMNLLREKTMFNYKN
jgi:hypothetical protein